MADADLRQELLERVAAAQAELASVEALLEPPEEPAAPEPQGKGKPKHAGKGQSQHKVFQRRESLLTAMLRQPDYETIFNIAVSFLLLSLLHVAISDFLERGVLLDVTLWSWCFRRFDVAASLWALLVCATFLILPVAHTRLHVLYLALQMVFFGTAAWATLSLGLPPATAMFLQCEQTRLSMKMHAYYREKMQWSVRKFATKPAKVFGGAYLRREAALFWYFLWVPTLVYRVSYPRSGAHVRWGFVLMRLGEVVGAVVYVFMIFRHTLPQTHSASFVLDAFACMLPGLGLQVIAFFLLLHAWQNMFAELTCFGDRKFYDKWWNCTTWGQFYRAWNGVVHDWIHTYIYGELIELRGWSRGAAMLASFAVSAVIHEWIVSFGNGFFFPILLVLFGGPGVVFVGLTRGRRNRFWNIFMWLMLALGDGILMVLYAREFRARAVPDYQPADSWLEAVMPVQFLRAPAGTSWAAWAWGSGLVG